MSQLGIGVMIRALCGRSEFDLAQVRGKVIASVKVDDDTLSIAFVDGAKFQAKDEGQSCCEHRYMTCDDDLAYFAGAQVESIELADAPDETDEYGEVHEVQFLRVTTSKGVITVASHNEHNGYYGGFSIEASVEAAPAPSPTPPVEAVPGVRAIELE